jgi:DNA-binding beta-propeller fold protein YncE
VGPKGQLYVVDSGRHRVSMYDAAGQPLGHFGGAGKGDGQLQGPVGIGVARDGTVYVADKDNQRLAVFSADGKFQRALPLVEGGNAAAPVDVAVAGDGKTLFVTTNDTHRVLAVGRDGAVQRGWGRKGTEPGQFQYPATLTLDAAGRVLVVDVLNYRVQVFDAAGAPLLQFGAQGAKAGDLYRPKGIAVDDRGRIFVSDSYLGVVQAFGADGQFVGVLGVGGQPTRFQVPTGLAFAGGRLFVTDMLAGKVVAYELEANP